MSKVITVAAFGVEADHPRNSDLLLQSIPGLRLRSTISAMKATKNRRGEPVIPVDQSRHLASFPQTPGVQLHVDPEKLTYTLIDPLRGNAELCDRIQRWMRDKTGFKVDGRIDGLAPREAKLDEHHMKTLCRELHNLVKLGHARHVKGTGPVPDIEEIDELPGKYLLNPGLRTHTTQPQFEEDWPEWMSQLTKAGG